MATVDEFRVKMSKIFGMDLLFNSRGKSRVIFSTRVAIIDSDGIVYPDAKLVLAEIAKWEICIVFRRVFLEIDENSVWLCVSVHRASTERYLSGADLSPLSWLFSLNGPLDLSPRAQLGVAKTIYPDEELEAKDWCSVARSLVSDLYASVCGVRRETARIDIETANFIMKTWAPKQITLTYGACVDRVRALHAELADLHELGDIIWPK